MTLIRDNNYRDGITGNDIAGNDIASNDVTGRELAVGHRWVCGPLIARYTLGPNEGRADRGDLSRAIGWAGCEVLSRLWLLQKFAGRVVGQNRAARLFVGAVEDAIASVLHRSDHVITSLAGFSAAIVHHGRTVC